MTRGLTHVGLELIYFCCSQNKMLTRNDPMGVKYSIFVDVFRFNSVPVPPSHDTWVWCITSDRWKFRSAIIQRYCQDGVRVLPPVCGMTEVYKVILGTAAVEWYIGLRVQTVVLNVILRGADKCSKFSRPWFGLKFHEYTSQLMILTQVPDAL